MRERDVIARVKVASDIREGESTHLDEIGAREVVLLLLRLFHRRRSGELPGRIFLKVSGTENRVVHMIAHFA